MRESRPKRRADMSTNIPDAIKAAEKARCAAMLENDNGALSALLDPRLQFHHATGAVDDKDAYMAKMAAGRIEYVGIIWSEDNVITLSSHSCSNTITLSSHMALCRYEVASRLHDQQHSRPPAEALRKQFR